MSSPHEDGEEVRCASPIENTPAGGRGGWKPPQSAWAKGSAHASGACATPITTDTDHENKAYGRMVQAGSVDMQREITPHQLSHPISPHALAVITSPLAQEVVSTAPINALRQSSEREEEKPLNQMLCGVRQGTHSEALVLSPSLSVRVAEKMVNSSMLPTPLLIPPPQQQSFLLQCEIPERNEVQLPKLEKIAAISMKTNDDANAWTAFLELRKETLSSMSRMTSFYDQVVKLQLTHEQEALSYRNAADHIINKQHKDLENLTMEYKNALSDMKDAQALLAKKTQEAREYETANYNLNLRLRETEQQRAHAEDRALIAENGRSMLEIQRRELEMSLEYTTALVKALRESLNNADQEKERAMQEQYRVYEANRREVIDFYSNKENEMLQGFNDIVKQIHEMMSSAMREREEQFCSVWHTMMQTQQQEHNETVREMRLLRDKEAEDHQEKLRNIEMDKEKWFEQYRSRVILLEQWYKEREQHMLSDIARRERELNAREEKMCVQRAQQEQDAKAAVMAKEVEIKAYYQHILEDTGISFDKERERLYAAFREQVQELSQLHLNQERELERLHREKEREMAQRYRVAKYEMDDHKGEVDLHEVSLQTQSALLSKFDAIETRQRERAQKALATLNKKVTDTTTPS